MPTQVSASSFKMPSSGSISLLYLKQKKRMNLISNSILKCIIYLFKNWNLPPSMVLCGCACLLLWFCNETRKKHLVGFRYKKLANANRVHIWVFGYHCFCSDTHTQHLGVRVCLIKCHLSFKYLIKEFDKSFIFILSVKKKPNLNKERPLYYSDQSYDSITTFQD